MITKCHLAKTKVLIMMNSNRPTTVYSVVVLALVLPVLPATAADVTGQRRKPDAGPADGGKPLKVFILAGHPQQVQRWLNQR